MPGKQILPVFALTVLVALAFMVTPAAARADESPDPAACGSPDESTLAVVECLGIDPEMTVPDKTGRPVAISQGGRLIAAILS